MNKSTLNLEPSNETSSVQLELPLEFSGQDNTAKLASPRSSAFKELGFKATIAGLHEEIRELYTADEVPWIIGYSGGKDSTATLQLIWGAIAELPVEQRKKTIYVISTDTMVENPIVAAWVSKSLVKMENSAKQQAMPVSPNRLTPTTEDTFWVNLIGKGYPAPRHKFRWCTERLKIKPSNTFIKGIVSSSGEAILVLGTRKAESIRRATNMLKHEKGRVRDRLSPNSSLPGSLVYTPIEEWTNDDVWFFLMQGKNPWGYNNHDLLGMYAGASADGECPLVVDASTPSCGDSRFGCWVCTLVEKDKSMTAMIQNDEEKEWMMPLLELRNDLDFRTVDAGSGEGDRSLRDFRRMSGGVQLLMDGRYIPGPYTQTSRENWLAKLLKAQAYIRKNGHADVRDLELITLDELEEIRRIWVMDKHELEDSLPQIYQDCTGESYPGQALDDNLVLNGQDMQVLKELIGDNSLHYELTRELLSVTQKQRASARRTGIYEDIEKALKKHFYESPEEAIRRTLKLGEDRVKLKRERENRLAKSYHSDDDDLFSIQQ